MEPDETVPANQKSAEHQRESTKSNWEHFWSEKKESHEVYSNNDRVLRNVIKVIDLNDKHVLEVGADTGRDSFGIVEHGASVFLIDYSIKSLHIIKNIAAEENVEVSPLGGNAFSLPFPDGSFDPDFHQGLLEHFREKVCKRSFERQYPSPEKRWRTLGGCPAAIPYIHADETPPDRS